MATDFRTGPLRYSEWTGLWKAAANAAEFSGEEWDLAYDSLRKWLNQKYLAE